MPLNLASARDLLKRFALQRLFIDELGWDHPGPDLTVTLDGAPVTLRAIAQKRGVAVLLCPPLAGGELPPYATRRKVEALVRKLAHEHLIIFANADHSAQKWQWVRRAPGRPTTAQEYDPNEALLQRLQAITFALQDEETLSLLDVTRGLKAAFDVEKVTKRFYERFKSEHDAFMGFLQGLPDEDLQRWYVSVTLNRLMFVYFIQKKQFLDGDPDYLRTKLAESQRLGADRFYRDFLCPLFFEGFAKLESERSSEINRLLGRVPYLNGGIFARHQLEERYGETIQIADAAFQRLFDFFDQYRWNLDERPLRADNEINPDVLGYIFEKYINQKQMGAYYTKEDITGYISKYTVLPHLLDQARSGCKIAFEGPQSVWQLLPADPDRYIYPAVRKGAELPLPSETANGLDTTGPNLIERRKPWNKPAPAEYALPTEIWREVVARRQRYEELRLKLVEGQVHEVNELITYNLDIPQFTQDVVENCEGPELLRAFWKALLNIKILDPTCGSGAFLFAALNLLEPLYEGCLERMAAFLEELERSAAKHRPEKFADFRQVLADVQRHPNRRYYILKTIIVHNLYGVDIMDEAVEICKLRLFLKLVAQVERVEAIEPLPDIDFNIRAGNTLVGFTALEEVQKALTTGPNGQMFLPTPEITAQLACLQEQAEVAHRAYQQFQAQQMAQGTVTAQDKAALRARLERLSDELHRALARTYAVDPDSRAYSPWLASHKPFHWLSDFYGIMQAGGFDVIIGNPPYVEYRKVRGEYEIRGFGTEECGNLYAFVLERSFAALKDCGFCGMIVQLSSICTDRMTELQKQLLSTASSLWISNYDDRPAKLFDGLEHIRAAILVSRVSRQKNTVRVYSTNLTRWHGECRRDLFGNLTYGYVKGLEMPGSIPKIADENLKSLVEKVRKERKTVSDVYEPNASNIVHYHRSPLYWIRSLDFMPLFKSGSSTRSIHHFKDFSLCREDLIPAVGCLINSTLFYIWFIVYGNGRNVALRDIQTFPCDVERLRSGYGDSVDRLFSELMIDYRANSRIWTRKDGVTLQEFSPGKSKPIIDEIDRVLAQHYGFSEEELDFIINYDIKYRMGAELESEEGEA